MKNSRGPTFMVFATFVVLWCASSASGKSKTFKIEGKEIRFESIPDRHITISANCVEAGILRDCAASLALKKADLSSLSKDLFGRNPGALLCSDKLGGRVVWTRDKKGNERTFCEFNDGSYVGSGTLDYFGRKNSPKSKH